MAMRQRYPLDRRKKGSRYYIHNDVTGSRTACTPPTQKRRDLARQADRHQGKAFDLIRNLPVLETRPENFLRVLETGKASTNVYVRRTHNFALGMTWLPGPVIVKRLRQGRALRKYARCLHVRFEIFGLHRIGRNRVFRLSPGQACPF
jgi:hypothetical protein